MFVFKHECLLEESMGNQKVLRDEINTLLVLIISQDLLINKRI